MNGQAGVGALAGIARKPMTLSKLSKQSHGGERNR